MEASSSAVTDLNVKCQCQMPKLFSPRPKVHAKVQLQSKIYNSKLLYLIERYNGANTMISINFKEQQSVGGECPRCESPVSGLHGSSPLLPAKLINSVSVPTREDAHRIQLNVWAIGCNQAMSRAYLHMYSKIALLIFKSID